MSKDSPRILIAAGGTGGHIFPALHVARAVAQLAPGASVAFIGSGRPLEQRLIDGAGYKRFVLPSVRIMQQGVVGLLKFALSAPVAMLKVRALFREYKPDVVVGMGGYVSVLPVLVARLMGIPTWIHEAELYPGLANKLLGLFSSKVSVAFESTKMLTSRELLHTGHPVRPELAGIATMPSPERPRQLLIVGGSQGARAIDEAFIELAPTLQPLGVVVRHQTREENCQRLIDAYGAAGVAATVQPFISDMPEAFRWCDIVVSRAGAGAISELAVVNRPAVLVPYPFAQGGHQVGNAQVLVDAGKAVMIEEGANFPARVLLALRQLLEPAAYRSMRQIAPNLIALDAASKIAAGILELQR